MQHGLAQSIQRWPLADDIIECLTEIDGLDEREGDALLPIFDPNEFLEQHPEPSRQAYTLEDDVLEQWAVQGTNIRARFQEKAELYG